MEAMRLPRRSLKTSLWRLRGPFLVRGGESASCSGLFSGNLGVLGCLTYRCRDCIAACSRRHTPEIHVSKVLRSSGMADWEVSQMALVLLLDCTQSRKDTCLLS